MENAFVIREARLDDEAVIKRLVRAANLDPLSLHWENFLVAESAGRIVGVGQVKPFPNARELGSLVVLPSHRGRGIGSAIVRALIARESGDIYLLCRHPLESYYAQFGFHRAGFRETRGVVQAKLLFAQIFRLFGARVIAMKRENPGAG